MPPLPWVLKGPKSAGLYRVNSHSVEHQVSKSKRAHHAGIFIFGILIRKSSRYLLTKTQERKKENGLHK